LKQTLQFRVCNLWV